MIQFEDLKFTEDHWNPQKIICNKHLGPGIRLSVIQGPDCYSDKSTYEVALFLNTKPVPLQEHEEVLGWATEQDINELLVNIQSDPLFISKMKSQYDR